MGSAVGGGFDIGFFLGLTTAMLFGAAIIPARKAVVQTSAVVGVFLSLLAGLPVLIMAVLAAGEFSSLLSISPLFVGYLAAAVSVVGSLVSVAPLFTLVFSFIFIRRLEVTRYQVLLGALLVVVGAILVGRSSP